MTDQRSARGAGWAAPSPGDDARFALAAGTVFVLLLVLVLVAAAPRLFLAWAVPIGAGSIDPSRAPDEAQHVPVVQAIAALCPLRFPAGGPHAAYIPAVYVPQAATLALLSAAGAGRPSPLRFPVVDPRFAGAPLARAGSVLAGVAGVLLLSLIHI